MKKSLIIVTASLFLAFNSFIALGQNPDSLTFVTADWGWKQLEKGARAGYAQMNIFNSVQSISVIAYPARKFNTELIPAERNEAATTSAIAGREKCSMAANGSYFNVKELTHTTFFCKNGKILAMTEPAELYRCDGMITLKDRKGHLPGVSYYTPGMEQATAKKYKSALVAGPVLLKDGQTGSFDPQSQFNCRRHPRTFMGITDDGWIYLVVVDGRFKGQADGASVPELVQIARWLGLKDAINLDGGGSSTLWSSETGVLNHPYDNKRFDHQGERTVPNIIGVRRH